MLTKVKDTIPLWKQSSIMYTKFQRSCGEVCITIGKTIRRCNNQNEEVHSTQCINWEKTKILVQARRHIELYNFEGASNHIQKTPAKKYFIGDGGLDLP